MPENGPIKKIVKKGDTVICIDDEYKDSKMKPFKISAITMPVKGQKYTVREVKTNKQGVGYRLEEIKNKEFFFADIARLEEPTFKASRFEKID